MKTITLKTFSTISALLFLASALFLFSENNFMMGLLHIMVAAANIFCSFYFKNHKEFFVLFSGLLNALISFIMIWFYADHNNPRIKVIWMILGFSFLLQSVYYFSIAFKKYI